LKKILLCLESYFIRRLFSNVSTKTLGDLFNNLYNEIKKENSSNLVDRLRQVLINHQGSKRFPEDDEFRKGIIEKDIYNTNQIDRVKLILERLETYLCIEEVNPKTINIEHIMPQTLNDEWKILLGENCESLHQQWIHRLGNLTLTGCNPELSNKSFKSKKSIYETSNLSLNKYFKDKNIDNWNESEIKKRAEFIADIAIEVWSR
jgi:hypothetical protein